jgi:hypothetical protein
MAATVLTAVCFIQLRVIQPAVLKGEVDGLSPLTPGRRRAAGHRLSASWMKVLTQLTWRRYPTPTGASTEMRISALRTSVLYAGHTRAAASIIGR